MLTSDGPMDSPWPMYCHDVRHTGRSPYSTADNPLDEKWRFKIPAIRDQTSPIMDNDGIIYFASREVYALYPNGTQKWMYDFPHNAESAPAIDENGIIYIGTIQDYPNDYLYAIYSSNGSLKWKYGTKYGPKDIRSSPAIGNDGTIYFVDSDNHFIVALYPNGTLRWRFGTDHVIFSSPAIGLDGTIYCGSHDNYVYALYPNNGTLKWRFKTGNWVHGSPTIGDDGTVYIGSDDDYLYALSPDNGSVIWKTQVGAIWGSPALGEDGTLHFGTWEQKFHAVNPDGTIKWSYNAPGRIWLGSSPAISADGTIYFGTTWIDSGTGAFIALNSDGTERFKYQEGVLRFETSPAIAPDGTVYAASADHTYTFDGYLHAFGKLPPKPPNPPTITGPSSGKPGTVYSYKFVTTDPNTDDVYYYIEWGDNTVEDWFGSYNSGEEVTLSHTWSEEGTYVIRAKAKDIRDAESDWATLTVSMPKNKVLTDLFFLRFLERLPILQKLLLLIN